MVSAECFRHTEHMDEYFDYTFSDRVAGFLSMMDMGTVALAFFLTLPGIPLLWYKFWVGIILLGIALVLAASQVASRLKHIRKIRALRMSNNNLEVRHPVSNAWLPAASIESFRKEDFSFVDPWRPITVGYPGIEIRLKGVSQPAEDLFAYVPIRDEASVEESTIPEVILNRPISCPLR